LFGIGLQGGDFVSQELSGFASCMGDQRLFWRKRQFEFLAQKGAELLLDFLRL